MIPRICAVAAAGLAIVGAAPDQRIFAGVLAVLFLACVFVPKTLQQGTKILMLSVTGFPLIFTAGHPVVAGLLAFLLILLILEVSGRKTDREGIIGSLAAGILTGIFAAQLYTLIPILIVLILLCAGVFYLFVRSYRLSCAVEEETE